MFKTAVQEKSRPLRLLSFGCTVRRQLYTHTDVIQKALSILLEEKWYTNDHCRTLPTNIIVTIITIIGGFQVFKFQWCIDALVFFRRRYLWRAYTGSRFLLRLSINFFVNSTGVCSTIVDGWETVLGIIRPYLDLTYYNNILI